MLRRRTAIPFISAMPFLLMTTGCFNGKAGLDNTREVTLPDGTIIRAELALTPQDQARGLMYRESLAPDRGMLFVHDRLANHPYWMANCKIPLDIIWMDADRRVVEISVGTPPCPSGGPDCPTYGGHFRAQYVLELGGGQAERHKIEPGSVLRF